MATHSTAPPERAPIGVVAATKLQVPIRASALVARRRLVGMLIADPDRRLILVSAPAGSGKTTLLSEWNADERERRPFAWLSLDPEDGDPVRFWICVLATLRTIEPRLGAVVETALRAPGTSLEGFVIPTLINELVELRRPIVLAIDDYHLVDDPRIHDSLGFLVDRMPSTVQLAIATRVDPPLALPRLRARGQLTEIRARDLRFRDYEAAAALRGFGLRLDAEQVGRLQRRTEGWAAGIQLVALTLRDRPAPAEFIASFAGDDRQIVDYLWSEVLDGQRPELLRFLLRSSILDRLSAPLCTAVTGEPRSAALLDELDRRNMFTIRLDAAGNWYRYHHLFGQLLRGQLEHEEPEVVAELHSQAACWHREHGSIPEAIRHALSADDRELALELTASHWSEFFNAGYLTTVAGWLDALPRDAVVADSRLWLARVWTAIDQGDLKETDRWLELGRVADASDGRAEREGWLAVLRAVHEFKMGELAVARASVDRLSPSEDDDPFWRTVVSCVRGVTRYWAGEMAEARTEFRRAQHLAEDDGNALAALYALGYTARIEIAADRPAAAERALDLAARAIAGEPQIDQHFTAMIAHLARAELGAKRGSLADADDESATALELAGRGAGALELSAALLLRAQVLHTRAESDAARALLREAEATLARCSDAGIATAELARIHRALRANVEGDRDTLGPDLSERELGVLRLLSTDLALREIGAELFVSVNTVKTHVRHIYAKLDASSRDEAVAHARERGLLGI